MNSLPSLLALSPDERQSRGVLHTPKEIAQQPQTWLATYDRFRERHSEISQFLQSAGIGSDAARRPTVFLIGAGTSDYIGRSLAQLLRRSWQSEVLAIPSTDLLTHSERSLLPGRSYLWISFSRSGESPEGIAVIERALQNHPGIHHLIVTCNSEAKMLRMAHGRKNVLAVVLPDEVNDRGLAMTSSFSNMVVFGQCLAHLEKPESYSHILQELSQAGSTFLNQAASCASELARENITKACCVGSGPLKAVATESALKLMELTAGRIQTMSESALGLRHGPMAALDNQTLLVAFLSGDEKVLGYETDLLEEINQKKLVKARTVVSAAPNSRLRSLAEHVLVHSHTIGDDYRPPVDVIFGQLLGLFFSLRCGLKPDHPSPNGAISRVVQNVLIRC
jgi:tagatose-6-phosphate ketose/aldose isomerase